MFFLTIMSNMEREMSYIEKIINDMKGKKVVFWGAGRRFRGFLKTFCIDKKIIPVPDYICDSTREIGQKELEGIPVLPFDELKKMDYKDTVIIITAGLQDLQAKAIPNELYYFPMYHCRSFETYFYLKENNQAYEKVLGLLADEKSRNIYKSLFESFINGSFWNQSLYENHPYFGNDIIEKLEDNDCIAFAGAFNGKHIDRALNNNPKVKFCAFEPNKQWFQYLREKYNENPNIKIYNNILWNEKDCLRFDGDSFNSGLDAHVCKASSSGYDDVVESVNLDSIDENNNISFIILDVEGSEYKALQGAAKIIKNNKPRLTVCLYHNIQDFIELPLLINELSGGQYKFYVKQHSCITPIETVLYAV